METLSLEYLEIKSTDQLILLDNQVWGILETRDQNYRSNARPRLRLADLLTAVVILQLHCRSER